MQQRVDYKTASPEAFKAMIYTKQQVHKSGLEESLLELVKIHASQPRSATTSARTRLR